MIFCEIYSCFRMFRVQFMCASYRFKVNNKEHSVQVQTNIKAPWHSVTDAISKTIHHLHL